MDCREVLAQADREDRKMKAGGIHRGDKLSLVRAWDLALRGYGGSILIRILLINYHLPVLGGLHHQYEWEAA